jgi:beta-glucosidase
VAILVVGGSVKTCGESFSRTSLDLPGHQKHLVQSVFETGTPCVVVLINGRQLSINWIDRYVPAILEAWYPGSHGGTAIADVLFGDYNPGGKLTVTFPRTVGQVPLNFPTKPMANSDTGIPRARVNGMLYPFGFGLSYTTFEYSNLTIEPETESPEGTFIISFDVTNTGPLKGDEVVQLYINDVISSVTTYEKVLRGFERVSLEPGETKAVSIFIEPDDLALWNRAMERVVEPGMFQVMVGASSEDIRLEGSFEIR